MDDIRRVDCFERLYQHLLRHEPDLQTRFASAFVPYAYRERDLAFFLTHLVALLSGIDEQTAEGKRRIRRFLLEIDEDEPEAYARDHLTIREKGGVFEKPLTRTQKEKLRRALENLKDMDRKAEQPVGIDFDIQLDRLECLPDRITWVGELMPCLSLLATYRYLNRIGYPVAVPTGPVQTFLFRLGLLEDTGSSAQVYLETCRVVDSLARLLKRSVGEMDLWIRAFVGQIPDLAPRTALCGRQPHCTHCDLTNYCHYYRFRRPRAADASEPLPLKEWRPTERPRERLMQHGPHALEDTELLAIVLRTGAGKTNVLELARRLIEKFGGLHGIEEATIEELQTVHGIGKMKAIELKAVFELGRRQNWRKLQPGDRLDSSEAVFEVYRPRFERVKQEEFLLVMLDNRNRVIREEVVSRGGLDASIVHPREVFKAAIRASAAAVIFVHNHPSGDPTPSHDDFVITQQLEEAAKLLRIRVLDHVVMGSESYYSFTEGETLVPGQEKDDLNVRESKIFSEDDADWEIDDQ